MQEDEHLFSSKKAQVFTLAIHLKVSSVLLQSLFNKVVVPNERNLLMLGESLPVKNNKGKEASKQTRRSFLQKVPIYAIFVVGGSGAAFIATNETAKAGTTTFQGKRFGWERGLDGQIHHYVEFDVMACFPSNARYSITGPYGCNAYPTSKPFCGSQPLDSYGVDINGHVRAGIRYFDSVPLPPDWFAANWTLTISV